MPSVPGIHAMNHPGVVLRTGSVADIDILSQIDLEAGVLFERAGLRLDLPKDHEFSLAERSRWLRCLSAGTVLIAVDASGGEVGFAATGVRDGEPYLDQLSVRPRSMRLGIGTELLNAATRMATERGGHALWLTTYSHLAWNRPFYERNGFVVVSADRCDPQIAQELAYERRWLPMPQERVVMRKELVLEG